MTPTPKQVVFLFMAGTVTAVVAFLFGVVVGRAVPDARPGDGAAQSPVRDDRPALAAEEPFEGSAGGLGGDGLSYYHRLEGEAAAEESLREPPGSGVDAPGVDAPAPGRRAAGTADGAEDGFTVQVGRWRIANWLAGSPTASSPRGSPPS